MLKLLKFPIMFLAFATITFVSCDSDLVDPEVDNYTLDEVDQEMMGRGKPDCFKLVFPITLVLKNGETKEIADIDEMKDVLKRVKGKGHGKRPKIQFPYQVKLKNGNIITVEDIEQQRELRRVCHISKARKCFKPVLPVTIVFADGSTEEVTTKDELKEVYRSWYNNHEDGEMRPRFQFPYDVKLKDGTVITIENREDLKNLGKDCRSDMVVDERCFKFNFPLTVNFPDGATVTLENPRALHDVFKIWKKNHQNSDRRPEFEFPIGVTMIDSGDVITLDSKEELIGLKESCE